MLHFKNSAKLAFAFVLTTASLHCSKADLVGPYTVDANTLYLFHFDEAAGGTQIANVGSKGGVAYAVNEATASTTPPLVTTLLGAAGYVNGATNFNLCMTNPAAGYEFGYDFNNSGAYQGDTGSATLSADAMAMTNFNIGRGGQTPFTMEALIQLANITSGTAQEIICTDSSAGSNPNRGFQFRIISGGLNFQFIGGPSPRAVNATIPTTGADAFVAGAWYHVAVVYDGANILLYWTKLDPANGAAHQIGSGAMSLGTTEGAVTGPLIIGNENRNTAGERFIGSIDEVRISGVARAANQMQFYSPLVTITLNPISQNIDYNQSVTFSVGASSLTALGYQWRFNSNSIPNATNSSYVIPNVAASNKGYYDVVVTNTAGYSATSAPASMVVGAANFLTHRYSFTNDMSDSVGTAHGATNGNAAVAGGALVLDGTSGTYMSLPGGLFNSGNATALTVEFWATFGANNNFVRVFDFGNTNNAANGVSYVGFSPHNGSGGHQLHMSPSDGTFQQTLAVSGTLDGLTRHIACVIDPPNKLLAIYTNGVLEATYTNLTISIGNLNDVYSYVGRSLFPADPYLNASIDELRIYNGALAGLSLKQSDDQGPNTVLADGPAKFVTQPANTSVPVGQTATFTVATVGYLPITYQWFKNSLLVPGATNASYSFVVSLGDNNATIFCQATNTIGVTTYVTNSTTATLSVFTPPTLAWIDAANGGSGDNLWNVSSLNWTNNVNSIVAFAQTNDALFDSRGSGSPNVDLAQAITPYNVTVNAANDYTLFSSAGTGSLNGQGGVVKQNSGTLIIDVTNNLSGAVTISGGKLQVGNGDSLGSLGSGPVTNDATLSINRADTVLNVGNSIHGSGTLRADGGGAVTLSGNSDFSGSTLINAGIVYLTSATGLGSAASGTTVAGGGQLYVTGNVDLAEGLSLAGTGDGNGALRKGGAGATAETGLINLALDSAISVDSGATLILSNIVSGNAALTASGGGTLTLSVNNTFNGGFTLNGPVVNVSASHALGAGTVTAGGPGRFILADGINLTNFVLASTVSPGAGLGLFMVNDNTNGTVTTLSGPMEFDTSPANGGNFVGPTTSGYLNVTGPMTNTVTSTISARGGNVRFSGGGDYTIFNLSGTTSLGANNGLCTNATVMIGISAAATFDLNGFNQTLTGLFDGAANSELVTNSAASLSTLTLNLASGGTYSGVIAGNIALVENGSGNNLLLSGTNAYTGDTTVNSGMLELAQPTLAARSTVTVASGALLQLDFTATNIVSGLVLNGVSQPLGVYNSTTSPTYITGSGSLQVAVVVATNPTNITASVSGAGLTLAWPADHLGWRLLAQTNNLAQGLSANTNDWTTVSGSAATNQVNITVDPAKPAEFYRLVYP